jgi:hypothetical protein
MARKPHPALPGREDLKIKISPYRGRLKELPCNDAQIFIKYRIPPAFFVVY